MWMNVASAMMAKPSTTPTLWLVIHSFTLVTITTDDCLKFFWVSSRIRE
jgi:hypothetical protein